MPNLNSDGRLITELRQNLLGLITIAVVFLVVFGMIKLTREFVRTMHPRPRMMI